MAHDLARPHCSKRRRRAWDANSLGDRRAEAHVRDEAPIAMPNAPARLPGRRAQMGTAPNGRRGSIYPHSAGRVRVPFRGHLATETHRRRWKDLVDGGRPLPAGRWRGDVVRVGASRLDRLHRAGCDGNPVEVGVRDGGRGPNVEASREQLLEAVERWTVGVRLSRRNQLHEERPRTAVGSPRCRVPHRGRRAPLEEDGRYANGEPRGDFRVVRECPSSVSLAPGRSRATLRAPALGRCSALVARGPELATLAGAGPRPELDDVPVRIRDVHGPAGLVEVLLVHLAAVLA